MTNEQAIYDNKKDAIEAAKQMSVRLGFAAIIQSKGKFYVESEPPMIRSFETCIAEYEKGIKI